MKRPDLLSVILAMLMLSSCSGEHTGEVSLAEDTVKKPQLQAFEKAEAAGLIDMDVEKTLTQKTDSADKEAEDAPDGKDGSVQPVPGPEDQEPAGGALDGKTGDTHAVNEMPEPGAGSGTEQKDPAAGEPGDTEVEFTVEEAKGKVEGPIDTYRYKVERVDTKLELVPEGETETHSFYVFAIKDNVSNEIGQIAVDSETGEKYTYLGDGKLTSYSEFPLFETKHEEHNWSGGYEGPAGIGLTLEETGDGAFVYVFSDSTKGLAHVYGGTAKSEDGEINFLISGDTVTVAGGGFTGNYNKIVEPGQKGQQ